MRIDGVYGKGNEIVRVDGVREVVLVAGRDQRMYLTYVVNFAVNCIGTNSTANFAENYSECAVRRATGNY